MQAYEPSRWRTDLIIFYDVEKSGTEIDDQDFFLNKMNCTVKNRRVQPIQPPMCTIIPYKAIKDRNDTNINSQNPLIQNRSIYEHLFNNVNIFNTSTEDTGLFLSLVKANIPQSYVYLDSIAIAYTGYPYFQSAGYDFLIRSDMDVFLTPTLGTWLPRYCNDFAVGQGGYSNTFNGKRLHRIATDMGLRHAGSANLGM
jgi:hypothetical protein